MNFAAGSIRKNVYWRTGAFVGSLRYVANTAALAVSIACCLCHRASQIDGTFIQIMNAPVSNFSRVLLSKLKMGLLQIGRAML
mmetsp:Transcript_38333/g.92730  ORF Transcript_38333/g.92730 Transcript_38333/m.92730 type:complete len:83 (+) Transcript_38333:415-663(+)